MFGYVLQVHVGSEYDLQFMYVYVYYPICSTYGIFTYISVIFRANVGKYSIHGAFGNVYIYIYIYIYILRIECRLRTVVHSHTIQHSRIHCQGGISKSPLWLKTHCSTGKGQSYAEAAVHVSSPLKRTTSRTNINT